MLGKKNGSLRFHREVVLLFWKFRNLGEAKAKYKCMDLSEVSCSLKRALP